MLDREGTSSLQGFTKYGITFSVLDREGTSSLQVFITKYAITFSVLDREDF